ncbi:MAG: hypothetical protein Q4F95_11680 [Oscillospiraceae bacterium]|nr:hypothetical protein [Oscillospiraceae bacterium]
MENIVDKIIQIDRNADERLVEAQEQQKQILDDSETEIVKLKQKLSQEADKRINEVSDFHKKETSETVEKLNKKCEEELRMLDRAYELRHEEIEKSIFRSIAGEANA